MTAPARAAFAVAAAVAAAGLAAPSPAFSAPLTAFDTLAPLDTVLRRVAGPAGFDAGDFDLMPSYPGNPPRALSAVDGLLRAPASVDARVPALRRDLRDTARGGFVRSEPLWRWLDVERPLQRPRRRAPSVLPRDAVAALEDYAGVLSADEIGYLARELPPLLRPTVEDTSLDPVAREIDRLHGLARTDSVMHLAGRLPGDRLADAARALDKFLSAVRETARADGAAAAAALVTRAGKAAGLPVVVGTRGPDIHRVGSSGLVFDPGGDDRYEFSAAPRPGSFLMIVDLSGNDVYKSPDSGLGAAAFLSAHIVADLGGDDRYRGGDFAFASALLGFARLFDAAGDDAYEARSASLGFAFRGAAVLEDRAGNDSYTAAYLSQAASGPGGFGVLLDGAGHDRYVLRPVFLDDLRYADRFLSLGQGFSTGFAPRHAGGLAVLWDRAGNDEYSADIFGQGAGYWFSLGLLMDDAGHDRMLAYQYAQGAGVHFAAGLFFDGAGDDVRVSKGVSQGCGHDGAFGLLADASGNDRNVAVDMSAGAGSANGLGVLVDFSGDDSHVMGNPGMSAGHADMRRDRGSLGFFLDLAGRDGYAAPGGDGSSWSVYDGIRKGEGHGLDAE